MRIIYCDGACSGNPGPAGAAAILVAEGGDRPAAQRTRFFFEVTNQIAELEAFRLALDIAAETDGPVEIRSDSQYVVKGVNEWLKEWKAKGWRNAQRKTIANLTLWLAIDAALAGLKPRPRVTWVRGHADDPWNDFVDRLAVGARSAPSRAA